MKRYFIFAAFLLLATTGCRKTESRNALIYRDCTGTYLRLGAKDYQVCNVGTTDKYPNGSRVRASFYSISSCDEEGRIVCAMLHPSEGWVKVTSIEQE